MKLKREARHKFMSLTSCWILWEPWLEEYLCNTVSMKVCEICKVREVVQSSPYSCSGQEFLIHYLNPYLTGEQGKFTSYIRGILFKPLFIIVTHQILLSVGKVKYLWGIPFLIVGAKSFCTHPAFFTVGEFITMLLKLAYRQLRTRRALSLFKDVPLRKRRALLPLNLCSDSVLLVLNRTFFKYW